MTTCGHEPETILILDPATGVVTEAEIDGPCAECFLVEDDAFRRSQDV